MKITLDLEAVQNLVLKHCQEALSAFGFAFEVDAEPIAFDFAYDEDSRATGLEIFQTPRS